MRKVASYPTIEAPAEWLGAPFFPGIILTAALVFSLLLSGLIAPVSPLFLMLGIATVHIGLAAIHQSEPDFWTLLLYAVADRLLSPRDHLELP